MSVLDLAFGARAFASHTRRKPRAHQNILLTLEVVLQLGLLEQRAETLANRVQLLLPPARSIGGESEYTNECIMNSKDSSPEATQRTGVGRAVRAASARGPRSSARRWPRGRFALLVRTRRWHSSSASLQPHSATRRLRGKLQQVASPAPTQCRYRLIQLL